MHRKTGGIAEDVAERIPDVDRVVARVGLLHVGQLERRGIGTGDVQAIEPPLVLEWRTGGLNAERDRLPGDAHGPDRLHGNLRCAL